MDGAPRKRVVILGGGLGGLSAAWVLGRAGHDVTILERSDHVGGLAVTKERDGFEYDLGPHNIHTVHEHVLSFLRRNFDQSLFEHSPKAKILKRGRFIDYPLRGIRVITSLPVWKLIPAGLSFFMARVRMFFKRRRIDLSFESWISNRFGRLLFKEYFRPYAEKVWGISADQIDRYVGEKRVPVISLTELLRAALFGTTAGADHPEFLDHNYYLRHGIGETVRFFVREIDRSGVKTILNAEVRRIAVTGGAVRSVAFGNGRAPEEEIKADYLLSTIPLNALVPLFETSTPSRVKDAAAGLDYCATVLLFLRLNREEALPSSMLYFSEPGVRFSRIYDVGMYSRAMVPRGRTMLCLEFPCSAGDDLWRTEDGDLAEEAIRVLERDGILTARDVEGWHTEKISHSYPRFRVGFQDRVAGCFEFLRSFRNLLSYGRQGSFAYLNTDGVMNQGFKAASAVLVAESTGYPCWEWFEAR